MRSSSTRSISSSDCERAFEAARARRARPESRPEMGNLTADQAHTGGCLCGAARYKPRAHCATSSLPLQDVSPGARSCRCVHARGAGCAVVRRIARSRMVPILGGREARCLQECGATLFWQADGRDTVSISQRVRSTAPTGVHTALQIHVGSAEDYYDINPRIPARGNQTRRSELGRVVLLDLPDPLVGPEKRMLRHVGEYLVAGGAWRDATRRKAFVRTLAGSARPTPCRRPHAHPQRQ